MARQRPAGCGVDCVKALGERVLSLRCWEERIALRPVVAVGGSCVDYSRREVNVHR
jgi:hypothetical protein